MKLKNVLIVVKDIEKAKKLFSLVFSFFLAIGLSLTATAPICANSAQRYWTGVDASGAIIMNEACPVIVESELLTFDIQEFPDEYYQSTEDYLAYSASVTAQYSFYNPADFAVTARLVFPFGTLPDYAKYEADDTAKFDITVDSKPIEKTLRHTLSYRGHNFEPEADIPRLHDGYVDDSFFLPDMPVTKYTYEIRGIAEEYRAANAAFDAAGFDGYTKLMLMEQSGGHSQDDGDFRVSTWAENGDNFTLYAIGKPLDPAFEWTFYKDGGVEDGEEIEGRAELVSAEELTFGELALSARPENSPVFDSDWYNAIVEALNRSDFGYGVVGCSEYGYGLDISRSLMRWYDYEITLSPGERIVNSVSAPIYPSFDIGWEPAVYSYKYLLPPARTWADFGRFDIVINTPYYLTESSLGEFTVTDNGYSISTDGLPEGELEFTLSSAENPVKVKHRIRDYIPIEIIISFSVIVAVLVVIIFALIVLVRKKRNKLR